MKPVYLLVALFWAVTTPAAASDYYVGLNLGTIDQSGTFDVLDERLNPSVGIDTVQNYQLPEDQASMASLLVGFKLGRDIALEMGYAKGEELESDIRSKPSGDEVIETSRVSYYFAAFSGIWPVSGSWALNARLGFSVWRLNYLQSTVDTALLPSDPAYIIQRQPFSDNAPGLFLGVGLSYGLSSSMELRLSFEQHLVDFSFTNLELDYDVATASLGLMYHF